MKKALSIAGFDPSGWAGVLADAAAFRDFGLMGFSAVTSLTAQDFSSVKGVAPVEPAFLKKELSVILDCFEIDAVKTGMLATSANVRTVARVLKKAGIKNVVVDPVMRSTGGRALLTEDGVKTLIKNLVPLSSIVTPNIEEASVISGVRIKGVADMEEAAEKIFCLGPGSVLIKGGHLEGTPVDILYDGKDFCYFKGRRIKGPKEAFHGTGCVLSSALASGLALGKTLKSAVDDAKRYTEGVIAGRKSMLRKKR
ncbi:MAG: bifunctional hydroxymethylpyrimidine kinase/phosphomethylpyrimidine kinase [Thermodesulfobacteriota bacterium]|nr:MAG: bifunctional hydroxymethylpyrimidine kinase/phosphomethylpyrimidine kinase [Thermodesulfobacteriota bacterium]